MRKAKVKKYISMNTCSVGWTRAAPSACPHRVSAPASNVLGSPLLNSLIYSCLPGIGGPWTGASIPDAIQRVLNKVGNYFPWPPGHPLVSTALVALDHLCCQGGLLAHAQLTSTDTPRSISAELLPSQLGPCYAIAGGNSSPGIEPCVCTCWTSGGPHLSIPPAYLFPSGRHLCP